MKKIAILACLQANDVCAGVSCLHALAERNAYFAAYQGEDVELCAFYRCSHCGAEPENDPGALEKLERIVTCGVETAHIGICTKRKDGARCPHMIKTADWLEGKGIHVIWGTH